MGTDIHAHIEILLNGKWEHWHAPKIPRNYAWFNYLAGVRDQTAQRLTYNPCQPTDLTEPTKLDHQLTFGHTFGWIDDQMLREWMTFMELILEDGHGAHAFMGYLCGNHYIPTDKITAIRMVFWFDN